MKIEAVKVPSKKSATAKPVSATESVDKDISLVKAWLDFKAALVQACENAKSVAVDLEFESSFDEKTHHTFNPDESVYVSDVTVCPKGNVNFIVPYGVKDKSFHFAEAELITLTDSEGNEAQLNTLITKLFRKSFGEFTDIPSVTMLERKYLATTPTLAVAFNEGEEYLKKIAVSKDRLDLYTKIKDFGIF